ncbi:MAG: ChbG/HpnK family deacetylase [Verrucomicrobiales bacterium]|nr:ChbG/HpnK family deacetylase [Verrucomicrobiales bacterium]
MIIINADDWGRSVAETDAAFRCWQQTRVTSVSAMVFMEDSERAADLARKHNVDAGLHLNFSENLTSRNIPGRLCHYHDRIVRFLKRNKYSPLVYNPILRKQFSYSYEAQVAEFLRLYGALPSHIDGHQHMHLCTNLLFSRVIPSGTRMRRNFTFLPGEKSVLNRAYRKLVDWWLSRKYHLPDHFFCILQSKRAGRMNRIAKLAKSSNVELMTHPVVAEESQYLMSCDFASLLRGLQVVPYAYL